MFGCAAGVVLQAIAANATRQVIRLVRMVSLDGEG
jgi:hypothetical protein